MFGCLFVFSVGIYACIIFDAGVGWGWGAISVDARFPSLIKSSLCIYMSLCCISQ